VINFIEKNIENLEIGEMEHYSWYLAKFFKWMLTMIEYWKEDVMKWRAIKAKEWEEREHALNEHQEWENLKT